MRPMILAGFFSELEKIADTDEPENVPVVNPSTPLTKSQVQQQLDEAGLGDKKSNWKYYASGGGLAVLGTALAVARRRRKGKGGKGGPRARVRAGSSKGVGEQLTSGKSALPTGGKAAEKPIATRELDMGEHTVRENWLADVAAGKKVESLTPKQFGQLTRDQQKIILKNNKQLVPELGTPDFSALGEWQGKKYEAGSTAEAAHRKIITNKWVKTFEESGLNMSKKAWEGLPQATKDTLAAGKHAGRLPKVSTKPMGEGQSSSWLDSHKAKYEARDRDWYAGGRKGPEPTPVLTLPQWDRLDRRAQTRLMSRYGPQSSRAKSEGGLESWSQWVPEGAKVRGGVGTKVVLPAAIGAGAPVGAYYLGTSLIGGDSDAAAAKAKAKPTTTATTPTATTKAVVEKPAVTETTPTTTGTTTTATTTPGTTPYKAALTSPIKLKSGQGMGAVLSQIPKETLTAMKGQGWDSASIRGYLSTKHGVGMLSAGKDYGAMLASAPTKPDAAWGKAGTTIRKNWQARQRARIQAKPPATVPAATDTELAALLKVEPKTGLQGEGVALPGAPKVTKKLIKSTVADLGPSPGLGKQYKGGFEPTPKTFTSPMSWKQGYEQWGKTGKWPSAAGSPLKIPSAQNVP
jgi:hypothetical protein